MTEGLPAIWEYHRVDGEALSPAEEAAGLDGVGFDIALDDEHSFLVVYRIG